MSVSASVSARLVSGVRWGCRGGGRKNRLLVAVSSYNEAGWITWVVFGTTCWIRPSTTTVVDSTLRQCGRCVGMSHWQMCQSDTISSVDVSSTGTSSDQVTLLIFAVGYCRRFPSAFISCLILSTVNANMVHTASAKPIQRPPDLRHSPWHIPQRFWRSSAALLRLVSAHCVVLLVFQSDMLWRFLRRVIVHWHFPNG